MTKCETCGHEMRTGIKIPELKIEVEVEVHDKNKCLKDITIPKGMRLLTIQEVIFLANSKYVKELKMDGSKNDFFFEQPFDLNKEKGRVAGFLAGSDGVSLLCNWDPEYSNPTLGVRFCRSLK